MYVYMYVCMTRRFFPFFDSLPSNLYPCCMVLCVCRSECVCLCKYMHVCVCMSCGRMCMCMCIYVCMVCICMYVCMYACTCVLNFLTYLLWLRELCTYTHAYIHKTQTHTHTHTQEGRTLNVH